MKFESMALSTLLRSYDFGRLSWAGIEKKKGGLVLISLWKSYSVINKYLNPRI